MGLKNGDTLRAPWDEKWKQIPLGPHTPPWWEPFSLERLIEARDAEGDCWWLNEDRVTRVEFKLPEAGRVARLQIDESGSDSVIEMLGSLVAGDKESQRKEADLRFNVDCTLSKVHGKVARRVVVALRDPLSRILSGLEKHIGLKSRWLPKDEVFVRKTFNNNFKTADEYLDALRVHDTNGVSGMHKRAMAVTHCRYCLNFMMPVKGYYIRDTDNTAADPTVKFVCTCKLAEEISKVADDWGLQLQNSTAPNLEDSTLTISDVNRKWIEETYAEDFAFYKEHCGQTCSDA